MDRVQSLEDPDVALRLAQRAALTSDTYLFRAVAQRAWEWRWPEVLDEVSRADPSLRNRLSELKQHEEKVAGQNSLESYYALQIREPAEV